MSTHFAVIRIVDAIREVSIALQQALDEGQRSSHIDAYDLLETLTSIADRLDPPDPSASDASQQLLEAARALLKARAHEMVTAEEWDRLQQAVEDASPG